MKPIQRFFGAVGILLFASLPVPAQTALPEGYVESAALRSEISSLWLDGEIDAVRMMMPTDYTDRYGNDFTVSCAVEFDSSLLAISVLPVGQAVQGGWTLYRRLSDGQGDHIRIYPVADPSVYITLRADGEDPSKGRTRLDLSVYGALACRDIPVGLPLRGAYTATLTSVATMTARTAPWKLLRPDPALYRDIESAVSVVRERLSTLVYLEDGAFDDFGNPVLIEDGSAQDPSAVLSALEKGQKADTVIGGVNCSGFAKWIVDGIVLPRTGSRLYVEPLKTPTGSPSTNFTEPYREIRDPFFALDWTRNLASAVVTVSAKKTVKPDTSGVDVRLEPFAGGHGYFRDVGYATAELLPLLYYLAVTEPNHLYLGAISNERGTPPLRQYHHVAVFFPYFTLDGQFTVAVFESAVETPVDTFIRNRTGSFINLVRVRVPERDYFQP